MDQLPKIVRERLRAGKVGDHPDPDLLAAYAENSLSEAERLPVMEHLSRCAECREVVMLLARADEPARAAAVSRAREMVPAQERSRAWFRMPVVRWAALAACVGLAATLVIRHEWKQTTPAEANLAAARHESRTAPTPPARQAEAEPGQNLPKAQSPTGRSNEGKGAHPVLSASAARPPAKRSAGTAKRRAPFAPSRSGSAGLPGSELASSAPLQIAPVPLPVNKGRATFGIVGGVAGSAGQAPRKQMIPAIANESAGGAALTPEGQAQSGRRIETQTADAFTAPVFQPKPAAQSASSGGAPAGAVGGVLAGAPVNEPPPPPATAAALKKVAGTKPSQWTLSTDGVLERSTDSGKTWTKVEVGNESRFRALSATGFDVWAGGADGLLYHSLDGGAHWTQIHPVANGVALTSTITRIDFTDARNGRLTTSTGETWITTDAGRTWQKQ